MTGMTKNKQLHCIICQNTHPSHVSLQVTHTGLSAGLSCIPQRVRILLHLPNPEDARMHLDPRPIHMQPFEAEPSSLFTIMMIDPPMDRQFPLIEQKHFIQAVDQTGLPAIVLAAGPGRTALHQTVIDNIPVHFHITPYTSVVGRFNIWAEAVTNNPEPTVSASARMIWKDLTAPQGQEAHTRIVDIIKQDDRNTT